ncbi:GSU2403 family nucleotidyltransferase fold protein [Kocuria sp.]|uniref:GSU2403 family nucleotidyltransferase fold protein n=1 Tax=Kocuria sp. TaxID=1871328 RepID=UPI00289F92EE|nr:GSU2403 family nucleotidyltransferase fold protein [Kocuria sp.]
MSLPPEYIAARSVLLDGLEALRDHLDHVILIGAQAVYLWAGEGDFSVSIMTTDADLALSAAELSPEPLIQDVLEKNGFITKAGGNPGQWIGPTGIALDLMVSEHQAGEGRRSARIPPHGKETARRGRGLAPALVDFETITLGALEQDDGRTCQVNVAGPAALIVAKCIKLKERLEDKDTNKRDRAKPKDALDILRLLRAVDLDRIADGFSRHQMDLAAAQESNEALTFLVAQSTTLTPTLPDLAEQAAAGDESAALSFTILVQELSNVLNSRS